MTGTLLTASAAAGIDFTGISLPFTVNDMITVSMGLLGVVGIFVLLGLALKFVPKWIALAYQAIAGGGKRA